MSQGTETDLEKPEGVRVRGTLLLHCESESVESALAVRMTSRWRTHVVEGSSDDHRIRLGMRPEKGGRLEGSSKIYKIYIPFKGEFICVWHVGRSWSGVAI